MHTLVLSGVLSVLIFTKTFVDGALTMSYTGSNEVDSTTYSLKCEIPGFSGQATMSKNGTLTSQCFNSGCITPPAPPYSFRQVGTAIYVDFSILAESEDGIQWTCAHDGDTSVKFEVEINFGPISQMITSIATEETTSINSISEFSNITIPMIVGSKTTTSDILVSTSSLPNTVTTNFHSNTETTNFDAKTETTTPYANTKTSDYDANTQINEIQTNTLRFISTSLFTYQSMSVSTAVNGLLGSLDFTSEMMAETFAVPGYSSPSYNERTLPLRFETSDVFPQSFSVSPISSPVDTLSDDLFHNIHIGSDSLITTGTSGYPILSVTISPLMSSNSPFIDTISFSSSKEDPSFSSQQYLSESNVTLPKISVSSQLPYSTIDTMNHFLYTTNTLIPTYLEETSILFDNFTNGYQTFSQVSAAAASTSLDILNNSTDHYLSLQTTEYYHETMQTEFTSFVTTPLYESHTDSTDTRIYSKDKVTSEKSYMHTSIMPSQTQLASTIEFQYSTTGFEPYSQSHNEGFSSESSDDLLSTLQSKSFSLQFNTKTNVFELDSYMKFTNVSTFESQSSILTMDRSHFTNTSSIQVSTVLLDFKTILLTSIINVNSKIMPSKIKSSSKQTTNVISYNEIETSFKDSMFSLDSFSGSLTSNNDHDMTSLSSGVSKSISTMSTNIIQSGLSEKNKTIIFISTSSVVIAMIVVILLIIFVKTYMSKINNKPPTVNDQTSWSNNSIPPKTAFPDHSFTGKSIHPLLNTSSLSFKMFHYEQHWNDIV